MWYVLHAPDRAVKASGSEAKTLSDVLEEQITFYLSFERNLWLSGQHRFEIIV
jgi:hypothetical protein